MIHVPGAELDAREVMISGGFLWRPSMNAVGPNETPDNDEEPYHEPWARRLDPLSVRAAWCVGKARQVAGVPDAAQRPNSEGVCLSTAMGAQQTRVRYASRLASHGLSGTNPIDFPDSIDGAPAAHVALRWGLQGPSFTFVGGADCAYRALVVAARQLVQGRATRMHVVLGDVSSPPMSVSSTYPPEDIVLALVLECSGTPAESMQDLLVGFQGTGREQPLSPESARASSRNPLSDETGSAGVLRVAEAWLGLRALMGSLTIACQDASKLDGSHCNALTNPQWPELAFVRAEKR
jgi:hypothetical protein